jgi:hypothetical protein
MIKDLWEVIRGRLSTQTLRTAQHNSDRFFVMMKHAEQEAFLAQRDLSHARAGIEMLKSQLPPDWEDKQRKASDELAEQAITKITINVSSEELERLKQLEERRRDKTNR